MTYDGFVNGETEGVLGGPLSFSGTAQGATNAGSYTITPGGLTSDNYAISFVDGTLTINQKDSVITWPTGITIAVNQELTTGLLPAGNYDTGGALTIDSATVSWSGAGTYTVTLKYTPDDTTNYKTQTHNYSVTVEALR